MSNDNLQLHKLTLLQPEEVLEERLIGGTSLLAHFLSTLKSALAAHYAETDLSGSRDLFVAIGPEARCQFWLVGASILPAEEAAVLALAGNIDPPGVKGGPIVVALTYSVRESPVSSDAPTTPLEWRAAVDAAGRPLNVDEVIEAIWSKPAD